MSIIDVSQEDVCHRAGPDVSRHRQLCRAVLRDKMRQMIAEVSMIGMGSGSRRFKLQLPVLEEYAFEYSHRREFVVPMITQQDAIPGRGDQIKGPPRPKREAGSSGGGEGEPVYEVSVDLDEIREFLFADLELPNFLRKQLRRIPIVETGGLTGSTRHGPQARLHRRASVRQRNRRISSQQREQADIHQGFVDDDLRFRRLSQRVHEVSNAVCIFMLDVSGSMGWRQKYLARAFFWLLDTFVRSKYERVEEVFLIHHSTAREVSQDQFFHTMESGGTRCSSVYNLALEIMSERYPQQAWNIYSFHLSDGDNWGEDNSNAFEKAEHLCQRCNLFGYGQVSGWVNNMFDESEVEWSTMFQALQPLVAKYRNAALVQIRHEQDIYPQFRHMLEGERVKGGAV